MLFAADDTGVKTLSVACPYIRYALWNNENTVNAFILNDPSTMADIYASSLQAKYESVLQTVSSGLGLGDDLTALTKSCAELVHNAAEQAIFDWAARREIAGQPPRPISNLQHLLDEYCAIADHL